jgi:hypothetical protein
MADYLLIGVIILGLFLIGLACIVWPRRMRWLTRNISTTFLPEGARLIWTRIVGIAVVIFSLILLHGLVKDLF